MKPIYFRSVRSLSIIFLIIFNISLKAQVLNTGDLVFTGYQASGPTANTDQFSFVPLVSLPNGTVIKFTDNGWNGSNLAATESVITYTVTGPTILPGREITIIPGPPAVANFTDGSSAGTVGVSGSAWSLATTGDQLFAYQGPDALPTTFISGIQMNVDPGATAAGWDPAYSGNGNSMKPASLTSDVTAIWIGPSGEFDNAKFTNCAALLGTAANVRASVNNFLANSASWTLYNQTAGELPPFTLPTRCTYMGLTVLPVSIESFTGKLNSDKTATLQWKTGDQQDAQNYTLEESADGSSFRTLTTIIPGASNSYSYTDLQVATGNNYYRLKTTELSGKIAYSKTIVINLKAGMILSVYPNPVTDKLTVQQFGTARSIAASLADTKGTVLQNLKLTGLQQTINMEGYAPGIYLLKLDDGTVFKIIKQ